ncbi:sigma-70 family RNA polymerase sigma factor [Flavobacterium sp. WW92]|uniref:RNA polymerase sigma factor n=1 Tax=unclassified Flavobacterium TaxID=196869 RepID=UPI002224B7BB|nr:MULTISPECIES: sigma-70 family RNA polymerase sigma factor [unclassified Flavobacterium]WDO14789.1 sigma-70 family RNA polymerase sigma factor [Flavobacterium sp. WW92]
MLDEQTFIKDLLNPKTQNKAFQLLLSTYQKPLYNHIRNIVLNHDDANDVLQNTFVKVFQHLANFKGESKLFSWLYRIATNEAITFLNAKAKRNGMTSENFQQKQIESLKADSYFEGDVIQLKLQKAITTLPEKQQLVFKMRYFEELKYEQLSEILGTSVGALKASYHHAVKKIEEYMLKN